MSQTPPYGRAQSNSYPAFIPRPAREQQGHARSRSAAELLVSKTLRFSSYQIPKEQPRRPSKVEELEEEIEEGSPRKQNQVKVAKRLSQLTNRSESNSAIQIDSAMWVKLFITIGATSFLDWKQKLLDMILGQLEKKFPSKIITPDKRGRVADVVNSVLQSSLELTTFALRLKQIVPLLDERRQSAYHNFGTYGDPSVFWKKYKKLSVEDKRYLVALIGGRDAFRIILYGHKGQGRGLLIHESTLAFNKKYMEVRRVRLARLSSENIMKGERIRSQSVENIGDHKKEACLKSYSLKNNFYPFFLLAGPEIVSSFAKLNPAHIWVNGLCLSEMCQKPRNLLLTILTLFRKTKRGDLEGLVSAYKKLSHLDQSAQEFIKKTDRSLYIDSGLGAPDSLNRIKTFLGMLFAKMKKIIQDKSIFREQIADLETLFDKLKNRCFDTFTRTESCFFEALQSNIPLVYVTLLRQRMHYATKKKFITSVFTNLYPRALVHRLYPQKIDEFYMLQAVSFSHFSFIKQSALKQLFGSQNERFQLVALADYKCVIHFNSIEKDSVTHIQKYLLCQKQEKCEKVVGELTLKLSFSPDDQFANKIDISHILFYDAMTPEEEQQVHNLMPAVANRASKLDIETAIEI